MDIFNFFMDKMCWDIFIDNVHPCLDIDSRITCGFISKVPLTFNNKYFEMRTRYVVARLPPFLHMGGKNIKNGIEFVLKISETKIIIVEISEYHINIHISYQHNHYDKIYEEIILT